MYRLMIVLLCVAPLLHAQEEVYEVFDQEIARLEHLRNIDIGITGAGGALLIVGASLLVVPAFFSGDITLSEHYILSGIGFGALGLGVTFIIGGGISWGIHNVYLWDILKKEAIYRRLQQ